MMSTQVVAIQRTLYYIFFGTAFIGPALLSIPAGPFSLFPSRILFVLVWIVSLSGLLFGRVLFTEKAKYFLGLFFVWAVASLLWVPEINPALRQLFNLAVGVSLVVLAPEDSRGLKVMTKIWLGFFIAFVSFGLFEHLTTWHLPVSRLNLPELAHVGFRATAVFYNENDFATFLSLSLPLAVGFFFNWRSLTARFTIGFFIVAAMYLVFVSTSRINYLALLFIVIAYPLLMVVSGKKLKAFTVLLLMTLGVYLFMILAQPVLLDAVGERWETLWRLPSHYLNDIEHEHGFLVGDSPIAIRINLIRNSALYFRDSWGLGHGIGSFEHLSRNSAYHYTGGIVNPHSLWAELAAEFGVGSLAYLAFLLSLAVKIYFKWRRERATVLVGWTGMVLLLLPILAFSPSRFLTFPPHWLFLAVATSLIISGRERCVQCE